MPTLWLRQNRAFSDLRGVLSAYFSKCMDSIKCHCVMSSNGRQLAHRKGFRFLPLVGITRINLSTYLPCRLQMNGLLTVAGRSPILSGATRLITPHFLVPGERSSSLSDSCSSPSLSSAARVEPMVSSVASGSGWGLPPSRASQGRIVRCQG